MTSLSVKSSCFRNSRWVAAAAAKCSLSFVAAKSKSNFSNAAFVSMLFSCSNYRALPVCNACISSHTNHFCMRYSKRIYQVSIYLSIRAPSETELLLITWSSVRLDPPLLACCSPYRTEIILSLIINIKICCSAYCNAKSAAFSFV